MAIVDCTWVTVQLALYSTTAVSVSLISIFPDRKNFHYPKYCIFDADYKLVKQRVLFGGCPPQIVWFGVFRTVDLGQQYDTVSHVGGIVSFNSTIHFFGVSHSA